MLLVISKYDATETASWLAENDWTMPMLVDGRELIETYGILNESALDNEDHAGIPHPTTVIIDKSRGHPVERNLGELQGTHVTQTMLALLADIND